MQLSEISIQHPEYWWWVKDPSSLSDEAIIEGILNYGDYATKKQAFNILGLTGFADIFSRLIENKRSNLRKEARVFWMLYLNKHSPHA